MILALTAERRRDLFRTSGLAQSGKTGHARDQTLSAIQSFLKSAEVANGAVLDMVPQLPRLW